MTMELASPTRLGVMAQITTRTTTMPKTTIRKNLHPEKGGAVKKTGRTVDRTANGASQGPPHQGAGMRHHHEVVQGAAVLRGTSLHIRPLRQNATETQTQNTRHKQTGSVCDTRIVGCRSQKYV